MCLQMCQHVRGRRSGSSQRGDRETGIPLRVPGCEPAQLHDIVIVIVTYIGGDPSAFTVVISPRRFVVRGRYDNDDQYHDDDDDCVDEDEQWRRGRGRRGGGRFTGQKKTISENAREIGESRRYSGELHDCWMADTRLFSGSIDDIGKCNGSTVRVEEAGSSKSLQPGSGGRRDARPIGRNGTPSRRLENRFYPTARSQGGQQTAHCWQNAFLSRSFSSGIQVWLSIASKVIKVIKLWKHETKRRYASWTVESL